MWKKFKIIRYTNYFNNFSSFKNNYYFFRLSRKCIKSLIYNFKSYLIFYSFQRQYTSTPEYLCYWRGYIIKKNLNKIFLFKILHLFYIFINHQNNIFLHIFHFPFRNIFLFPFYEISAFYIVKIKLFFSFNLALIFFI